MLSSVNKSFDQITLPGMPIINMKIFCNFPNSCDVAILKSCKHFLSTSPLSGIYIDWIPPSNANRFLGKALIWFIFKISFFFQIASEDISRSFRWSLKCCPSIRGKLVEIVTSHINKHQHMSRRRFTGEGRLKEDENTCQSKGLSNQEICSDKRN